jgi:rhodanese-related sulfurtransferase
MLFNCASGKCQIQKRRLAFGNKIISFYMMVCNMKSCFLFVFCVVLLWFAPAAMAHTDISVVDANDLMSSTSSLIIVDVREDSEYCGELGHIPGAYSYPWNSGVFQDSYKDYSHDAKLLIVCRSGYRSNAAAKFLDSKGYLHVYDMLGGTIAWKKTHGYKTVGCVDSEQPPIQENLTSEPKASNINFIIALSTILCSVTLLLFFFKFKRK